MIPCNMPTLDELNNQGGLVGRNDLLLLRMLCRSDFAHLYDLLKPSTVADILHALTINPTPLYDINAVERAEYHQLFARLERYAFSVFS
jgi:hypothetical protein